MGGLESRPFPDFRCNLLLSAPPLYNKHKPLFNIYPARANFNRRQTFCNILKINKIKQIPHITSINVTKVTKKRYL